MITGNKTIGSVLVVFTILFSACKQDYVPKPKGYFRIEFPDKDYQTMQLDYPYTFEFPVYTNLVPDTSYNTEPYWLNLKNKTHKVQIHLSYKNVANNLAKLTEDSYELAYKHSIKANSIEEQLFINPEKDVYGTIYQIKGNVASPMQFHLTDSTKHFVRGSFYISELPNYDSLSPTINFFEKDIFHLIETFSWK